MAETVCYKCKSKNKECRDESTVQWWGADGWPSGVQVVASFRCMDCGATWAEVDPSDEVMAEGGNYIDEEDQRHIYG